MGVTDNDDDIAFAAMVATHQQALYAYARRRVDPDDAADVVAEVFAAAWRHRDKLPDRIEPWLYRTAWNALLHQFRGARRRANLSARLQLERASSSGDSDAAVTRVRAALARLKAIDQEVLRLSYWEHFDAPRIAEIIGGTPQAARVRLHRARRRLAVLLRDAPEPAHDAGLSLLIKTQEMPR